MFTPGWSMQPGVGAAKHDSRGVAAYSRRRTRAVCPRSAAFGLALLAHLGVPAARADTEPAPNTVSATHPPAEPPSALQRVFWFGPSTGVPSTGKSVLAFTLYGLGVGGAAFGGIYLNETVRARLATDRFIAATEGTAPCYDRAGAACQKLTKLRATENTTLHLALLGAAGAGACVLAGLVTAFLWENEPHPAAMQVFPLIAPNGSHATLAGAQFTLRANF
jgi:hypothetical protein